MNNANLQTYAARLNRFYPSKVVLDLRPERPKTQRSEHRAASKTH